MKQLIEGGQISSETLAAISRPLLPRDQYIEIANQHHEQRLKGVKS